MNKLSFIKKKIINYLSVFKVRDKSPFMANSAQQSAIVSSNTKVQNSGSNGAVARQLKIVNMIFLFSFTVFLFS